MSTEIEVLKFVCRGLEQAKISYMLTGSFAANFYAIPRMTRDLDFYLEKDAIDKAIAYQGMFNIIIKNIFKNGWKF